MMSSVVSLCGLFPETALWSRRALGRLRQRKARSGETSPRQGLKNVASVVEWLRGKGVDVGPTLPEVRQFSHGQSNPTYVLRWDSRAVVLRKQPSGKLLKGAHDVGREYALAVDLSSSGVPAPRALGYCADPELLGTEFWCYDYVPGRHFKDAYLEEASREERAELVLAAARAAAALHSAEPSAALVERLGGKKKDPYLERQVRTWTRQYTSADERLGVKPSALFESVSSRLGDAVASAGADVAEADCVCVAHGDFRCDNMIFARDAPRVDAVLDWELGALGHPVSDLAYLCMPYDIPPLPFGPMSGFLGLDLMHHGLPPRLQVERAYVDSVSRPEVKEVVLRALPHVDLFGAVAYFRLASIVRGVYARARQGNAAASNAQLVGSLSVSLLGVSRDLLAKRGDGGGAFGRQRARYSTDVRRRVRDFVDTKILPIEAEILERSYASKQNDRWVPAPELEDLKARAKALGLWNLFLLSGDGPYQLSSDAYPGGGLQSLAEYAPVCEEMGRSLLAPEVFNCSAPDTGNMEVLAQFGTEEQKARWLGPLLAGDIRSCYAMTEPAVASSDPTNLRATIVDRGDGSVSVSGAKWWTSGAMDPRCAVCIFMGRAEGLLPADAPRHARHSMVLVPMDKVKVIRPLRVFGFDDAPHGHAEIEVEDVVLDKGEALLSHHGDAFRIAQARLGPGRVHHCMRTIGAVERSLELTKRRVKERVAFGRPLADMGSIRADLARARIHLDMARHLVLHCARSIDLVGNKKARKDIAMIKVAVPTMACTVLDSLMQMWGAMGLSTDVPLAHFYSSARVLRQADGSDEVHLETIAKLELRDHDEEKGTPRGRPS